jgi:hypothetical protein
MNVLILSYLVGLVIIIVGEYNFIDINNNKGLK